jgi:adenine-specific DNA methylase
VVSQLARPGDLVFDAFSGSLATSAAFRSAGFEVACNDINFFSWVFATAYFTGTSMPELPRLRKGDSVSNWSELLESLIAPYAPSFPGAERGTYVYDAYCEAGRHSQFRSSRGSVGRRRFFSADNAATIDRALSRIRHWHREGYSSLRTTCTLTAILVSAVEKVSNTQGTYHDFPRDFVDERAKRPLSLKLPEPTVFDGPISRHIGRAQDSLEYASYVPQHAVLYLDPPYNFRQYTSYYFMLNLLSSYFCIEDLDNYFSDLQFVRGQNMSDDFTSTFCKRNLFIPSLRRLIEKSRCEYVVLSYFDGKNHWGEFKQNSGEVVGRELLSDFFSSELFEAGSLRCIPVERLNYQSYGGHSAQIVQELLFVAKKSMTPTIIDDREGARWTGLHLA